MHNEYFSGFISLLSNPKQVLVTLVCYIFLPRTTHQKQGQTCVEHLDSGRWSYLDFCNSKAQWLPMFSLFVGRQN